MKLCIVGGGTAGWLTASYFSKKLIGAKITMIDKEIPAPIGVGEGTIIGFDEFMSECGFEFSEWFKKLRATIKLGIVFKKWHKGEEDIYHPILGSSRNLRTYSEYKEQNPEFIFGLGEEMNVHRFGYWANNQKLDYKRIGLPGWECYVEQNCVHRPSFFTHVTNGYHIDAVKLTKYCKEKLSDSKFMKGKNFTLIESDVVDVSKDEEGYITSLKLKDDSEVKADLFIDCTGFKSLLQDHDKLDMTGRLFTNTAVVHPIQYDDIENEMIPYTRCDSVDHGWIWTIPTQDRRGSGMVFNRDVTDPEEAKQYFADYWNSYRKISSENRIDPENCRIINWDPFIAEKPWNKNVVSIGLSAGFIEPLEATNIALMQFSINKLYNFLSTMVLYKEDRDFYNQKVKYRHERVVDFITAHYTNVKRPGKFWQYVKDTAIMPQKEKQMMAHMKSKDSPIVNDANGEYDMLTSDNWLAILIQKGYELTPNKHWVFDNLTEDEIEHAERNRFRLNDLNEPNAIKHYDFVNQINLAGYK